MKNYLLPTLLSIAVSSIMVHAADDATTPVASTTTPAMTTLPADQQSMQAAHHMYHQSMQAHMEKIQQAKTNEERQKLMAEYHAEMQAHHDKMNKMMTANAPVMPEPPMPPAVKKMIEEGKQRMAKAKAMMEKVRAAKTPEEQNKLMQEHHQAMQTEMQQNMPPMPPHFQKMVEQQRQYAATMRAQMEKTMQIPSMEEQRKQIEKQMSAMQAHQDKMQAQLPSVHQPQMPEHMQAMRAESKQHMSAMQALMGKMQNTTDPAEQQKLIEEQQTMLKAHMGKMRELSAPKVTIAK